jgi:hypothetical protein
VQKGPAELEQTLKELAARIPIHSNEWIACLAAFISRSSDADFEALMTAIRAARGRQLADRASEDNSA